MNFEFAEKISNTIGSAKKIIYGQDDLLESIYVCAHLRRAYTH